MKRIFSTAMFVGFFLFLGTSAQGQYPDPSKSLDGTGCWIKPFHTCTRVNQDASMLAYMGYVTHCTGTGGEDVLDFYDVEAGGNNFFDPGPPDRGQPETFPAGKHERAFSVELSADEADLLLNGGPGHKLVWNVTGETAKVRPHVICDHCIAPDPGDESCGFYIDSGGEGWYSVWDQDTNSCVNTTTTYEIEIFFRTSQVPPDGTDFSRWNERLDAAKPALMDEVVDIFAGFTPSVVISCEDIAGFEAYFEVPTTYKSFEVYLQLAFEASALPDGASENTIVNKIQSEWAANTTIFDGLEDLLSELFDVGRIYYTSTDTF